MEEDLYAVLRKHGYHVLKLEHQAAPRNLGDLFSTPMRGSMKLKLIAREDTGRGE